VTKRMFFERRRGRVKRESIERKKKNRAAGLWKKKKKRKRVPAKVHPREKYAGRERGGRKKKGGFMKVFTTSLKGSTPSPKGKKK